ncbi:metallophosphoesterase [Tuwongella immobilis]|uniref:Uncharacterized metallophosphoesterase ykue: Calcineurin-like phosphoesterase n=1 Tax=Tuwongella immobilis TaxID=692036 RepID=A0A6C2YLH9_9BACT|nr:metallophosphoesterase [Tuwongella immobilis]VIP02234.1 uncharacterized metallophosphoesterase ykue : Calcineurin-like phosphoesterase OS=Polaribacter sp. MED152 GN=MED152_12784 PE=4 SV=1 [Tuwongella immobilis]VTS00789.1 uncharacterized metallophosphoesterase ykue : Calcineurin-like phosphoesterase OS=Polaribacter sp. MED152 GN=MED152_12784 PE=4 SV=1 [Tuwongella immobilis]
MTWNPWNWNRRQWMRAGFASGLSGLALGLYTWQIEPHWLEWVERDLPIRGLPDDAVGRTMIQLSDLHIGTVSESYLLNCLALTAEHSPDWVVLTGDMMSCQGDEMLESVSRLLDRIPRGKRGTVAVLGNHDYGHFWMQIHVADALVERMEKAGISVLRNSRATIGGLDLIGLDDLWQPNFEAAEVANLFRKGLPHLVLSHNPDGADLPVFGRYDGWILSGHTHGGQCKPPFLRPPIVPTKNPRYVAGEYELTHGRKLYINRGIGYTHQLRCNSRPEITAFRLTRAEMDSPAKPRHLFANRSA